jgi:hypothetical protein
VEFSKTALILEFLPPDLSDETSVLDVVLFAMGIPSHFLTMKSRQINRSIRAWFPAASHAGEQPKCCS